MQGTLNEQLYCVTMGISTATLATAIQAVKIVVSVYDGYEKGRFMKTDEAVRSEIQRRCEMLNRHAEKLERDCHEKDSAMLVNL